MFIPQAMAVYKMCCSFFPKIFIYLFGALSVHGCGWDKFKPGNQNPGLYE